MSFGRRFTPATYWLRSAALNTKRALDDLRAGRPPDREAIRRAANALAAAEVALELREARERAEVAR